MFKKLFVMNFNINVIYVFKSIHLLQISLLQYIKKIFSFDLHILSRLFCSQHYLLKLFTTSLDSYFLFNFTLSLCFILLLFYKKYTEVPSFS